MTLPPLESIRETAPPDATKGIVFRGESIPQLNTELFVYEAGYDPKYSSQTHSQIFSPYWCLFYNKKKGQSIHLDGEEIPLHPGQMVLVPSNLFFDYEIKRPVPHLWVHFSNGPSFLQSHREPVFVDLSKSMKTIANELIERLTQEPGEEDLPTIFHLSKALINLMLAKGISHKFEALPKALENVARQINLDLSADLLDASLAQTAGMTEQSFRRFFALYFKCEPSEYVLRSRVYQAARELAQTKKSHEMIVYELNFENKRQFSEAFVATIGMSPEHFRGIVKVK